MERLYKTSVETSRGAGLPYPPHRFFDGKSVSYLKVSSINYDYIPMALESPKVLWLDLVDPAPRELLVGTPVRLHITPGRGLRTQISEKNLLNSVFQVEEIIGSRVVLVPYKGSAWVPTDHSCNPEGYGYDMRATDVSPSMHNVKYGYGVPVSLLEYTPVRYTARATQLEDTQRTALNAWNNRFVRGWDY